VNTWQPLASSALALGLIVSSAYSVMAQAPVNPASTYDPRVTFAPLVLPDPATPYRSANGAPGPSYWQNAADYVMHAAIDPVTKVLANDEVITYTNNSPDSLDSLWIHLEQNSYRKDSRVSNLGNAGIGRPPRAGQTGPPRPLRGDNYTEGFVFESVEVGPAVAAARWSKADYIVDDTRMRIRLLTPLKPHGGQLRIHIKYHYTIPGVWGGRTSWGRRSMARSMTWRSGIRACACMTICVAGTRCRISARSSIWSMGTSIIT
jgi:hypothetical protein